jgi:cell division protein FtsZ
LIISITGGRDLTLFEVDEAASRIRDEADQDANIIVGATFDDSLTDMVRVSVVATGIDNLGAARQVEDGSLSALAARLRSDNRRTADRIMRGAAPPPPVASTPLRTAARLPEAARLAEARPAKPVSEWVRQAVPQGLDPYGRLSAVRNSVDKVLDIPAFLTRKAR